MILKATTPTKPKSRPRLPQRIRQIDEFHTPEQHLSRLCRARIELPSRDGRKSVVFNCCRPEHEDGTHQELGRVRDRRNNIKTYRVSWQETLEKEEWRDARMARPDLSAEVDTE